MSEEDRIARQMDRVGMDVGIYRKFIVSRTDGSSRVGGKHERCSYFVLDWEHDPFAVPAALAYAKACETTHPALANDLRQMADRASVRWALEEKGTIARLPRLARRYMRRSWVPSSRWARVGVNIAARARIEQGEDGDAGPEVAHDHRRARHALRGHRRSRRGAVPARHDRGGHRRPRGILGGLAVKPRETCGTRGVNAVIACAISVP